MNANLAFLMLVAVHVALCLYADESGSLEKKSIVNGFNAQMDFKFYVRVFTCDGAGQWPRCVVCGGSMITDTTVLTAAHCIDFQFYRENPEYAYQDPYIVVEDRDYTDIYSHEIVAKGHKIYPRYQYRDLGSPYDLGLVYLERRPPTRFTISLCPPHSDYSRYDINVISAYPIFSAFPYGLQQVRLREKDATTCPVPTKFFEEDIQICLTGDKDKDSCQDNSGAPVFPEISNTCLYGVVSWGSTKCDGFGIYPRVSAFKTWIEQNA